MIRAKVVGEREVDAGNDIYGNPIKRIQYEVKQIKVGEQNYLLIGQRWMNTAVYSDWSFHTQMFKGPNQDIEAVFTAPVSAVCGVTLEASGKKEYLISGMDWLLLRLLPCLLSC